MQDNSSRRILTVDEVRDKYGIPISTQRLWRTEGRFARGTAQVHESCTVASLIERWVEEQERATWGGRSGSHADQRQDDVCNPPRKGAVDQAHLLTAQQILVADGLATRIGGNEAWLGTRHSR